MRDSVLSFLGISDKEYSHISCLELEVYFLKFFWLLRLDLIEYHYFSVWPLTLFAVLLADKSVVLALQAAGGELNSVADVAAAATAWMSRGAVFL